MVGLIATSSKRAYAILRSAAPEPLTLWQATADPYLHRRCSNTVLAQSLCPEFTQIQVHRVSDFIQPSHPLSSPSPPAPNPSQHQSLFQ